ncbi:hypothetical protein [Streptomyces sp. NBC_01314]|uniref:hypothetical protein n=1 Tax=Streptomyces sp. NBC_01314 TaxID=2903821 RepID=UPI003093087E|nr:hypothetical protein OG622_46595 [Streptomyces sp. NBC_01314]
MRQLIESVNDTNRPTLPHLIVQAPGEPVGEDLRRIAATGEASTRFSSLRVAASPTRPCNV